MILKCYECDAELELTAVDQVVALRNGVDRYVKCSYCKVMNVVVYLERTVVGSYRDDEG